MMNESNTKSKKRASCIIRNTNIKLTDVDKSKWAKFVFYEIENALSTDTPKNINNVIQSAIILFSSDIFVFKSDFISRLCYMLFRFINRSIHYHTVNIVIELFKIILQKYNPVENLVLDWKVLYVLIYKASLSSSRRRYDLRNTQYYRNLVSLVPLCTRYFSINATIEIIYEFADTFRPQSDMFSTTFGLMCLFLPGIEEKYEKWLYVFFDAYINMQSLYSDYLFLGLLNRFFLNSISLINCEKYIPFFFTRLLNLFSLPKTQFSSKIKICKTFKDEDVRHLLNQDVSTEMVVDSFAHFFVLLLFRQQDECIFTNLQKMMTVISPLFTPVNIDIDQNSYRYVFIFINSLVSYFSKLRLTFKDNISKNRYEKVKIMFIIGILPVYTNGLFRKDFDCRQLNHLIDLDRRGIQPLFDSLQKIYDNPLSVSRALNSVADIVLQEEEFIDKFMSLSMALIDELTPVHLDITEAILSLYSKILSKRSIDDSNIDWIQTLFIKCIILFGSLALDSSTEKTLKLMEVILIYICAKFDNKAVLIDFIKENIDCITPENFGMFIRALKPFDYETLCSIDDFSPRTLIALSLVMDKDLYNKLEGELYDILAACINSNDQQIRKYGLKLMKSVFQLNKTERISDFFDIVKNSFTNRISWRMQEDLIRYAWVIAKYEKNTQHIVEWLMNLQDASLNQNVQAIIMDMLCYIGFPIKDKSHKIRKYTKFDFITPDRNKIYDILYSRIKKYHFNNSSKLVLEYLKGCFATRYPSKRAVLLKFLNEFATFFPDEAYIYIKFALESLQDIFSTNDDCLTTIASIIKILITRFEDFEYLSELAARLCCDIPRNEVLLELRSVVIKQLSNFNFKSSPYVTTDMFNKRKKLTQDIIILASKYPDDNDIQIYAVQVLNTLFDGKRTTMSPELIKFIFSNLLKSDEELRQVSKRTLIHLIENLIPRANVIDQQYFDLRLKKRKQTRSLILTSIELQNVEFLRRYFDDDAKIYVHTNKAVSDLLLNFNFEKLVDEDEVYDLKYENFDLFITLIRFFGKQFALNIFKRDYGKNPLLMSEFIASILMSTIYFQKGTIEDLKKKILQFFQKNLHKTHPSWITFVQDKLSNRDPNRFAWLFDQLVIYKPSEKLTTDEANIQIAMVTNILINILPDKFKHEDVINPISYLLSERAYLDDIVCEVLLNTISRVLKLCYRKNDKLANEIFEQCIMKSDKEFIQKWVTNEFNNFTYSSLCVLPYCIPKLSDFIGMKIAGDAIFNIMDNSFTNEKIYFIVAQIPEITTIFSIKLLHTLIKNSIFYFDENVTNEIILDLLIHCLMISANDVQDVATKLLSMLFSNFYILRKNINVFVEMFSAMTSEEENDKRMTGIKGLFAVVWSTVLFDEVPPFIINIFNVLTELGEKRDSLTYIIKEFFCNFWINHEESFTESASRVLSPYCEFR